MIKGHLRKRGNSWTLVVDLPRGSDGKRRQKWIPLHAATKKEAEKEQVRILHEINQGIYVVPSKTTVSEYMEYWLSEYAEARVAPKTLERYRELHESYIKPGLGINRLETLRSLQIQSFYNDLRQHGGKDGRPLSGQTVLHVHRLLHAALEKALKWDLLVRNPAHAVEPPKPEKKEKVILREEEKARLLDFGRGTRFYIPTLLALSAGLRRGEVLGLRWMDVDLIGGSVTVSCSLEQTKQGLRLKPPKTPTGRRTLALPEIVVSELRRHKAEQAKRKLSLGGAYQDNDLVCPKDDGSFWPPDTFSAAYIEFVERAGVRKVSYHTLRHMHCTQLHELGVPAMVARERMGHTDLRTTLGTYVHPTAEMHVDAADKLNAAFRSIVPGNEDVEPQTGT